MSYCLAVPADPSGDYDRCEGQGTCYNIDISTVLCWRCGVHTSQEGHKGGSVHNPPSHPNDSNRTLVNVARLLKAQDSSAA